MKLKSLQGLKEKILADHALLKTAKIKSYQENNWFTEEQCNHALNSIAEYYLDQDLLKEFIEQYSIRDNIKNHVIGLIPAGNLPLVGFHDMLCCFLSGKSMQIKLSDKDKYLMPAIVELLAEDYPDVSNQISFVDRLENFDAIIATGSNNTNRYFEHYFKDYPKILRKNRSSVCVLSGKETAEELEALADDAFKYFGLGCRSISKIYVPVDYDIKEIFPAFEKYDHYKHHHKFRNNYEYNNANLLLNNDEFLTDDVFILKEDSSLISRISTLHYEYYNSIEQVTNHLDELQDQIQCISTHLDIPSLNTINLGDTQKPKLTDFADGVDTVQFLLSL
jgi:hypothetical protein